MARTYPLSLEQTVPANSLAPPLILNAGILNEGVIPKPCVFSSGARDLARING
ncbi:MAG: hypothetical protein ACYDDS_13085 [Candidatus Sulfotelmatobacter sp.]